MSFDPVAYAMGKAGMTRSVLSALMAGDGGGGGVPGSLAECGWAYKIYSKTTVSGNIVTFPSKDLSGYLAIRPPVAKKWVAGDIFEIAIKVTESHQRTYIYVDSTTNASVQSKTGLFSPLSAGWSSAITDADATGEDVLTFTYKGNSNFMRFQPVPTNTTERNSDSYGTIEITGMKFNGTVIYGKV